MENFRKNAGILWDVNWDPIVVLSWDVFTATVHITPPRKPWIVWNLYESIPIWDNKILVFFFGGSDESPLDPLAYQPPSMFSIVNSEEKSSPTVGQAR